MLTVLELDEGQGQTLKLGRAQMRGVNTTALLTH